MKNTTMNSMDNTVLYIVLILKEIIITHSQVTNYKIRAIYCYILNLMEVVHTQISFKNVVFMQRLGTIFTMTQIEKDRHNHLIIIQGIY